MSALSDAPGRPGGHDWERTRPTTAVRAKGKTKVSIVGGSGGVGSALAHKLVISSSPYEIALLGRRPEAVACQLMDFELLAPYGHASAIRQGGIDDFPDSDVIVIAASVPFSPRKKRADFLHGNAEILRPYFREIAKLPEHWPGHVIIVTNPIDALCTWLLDHVQMHRRRILGYSWNDTLRLKVDVARALGVAPSQVEAWVIGEHGDLCIPLFDRVFVAGRKVTLSPAQQSDILTRMRDWYPRWGSLGIARTTVWSTAEGVCRMIASMKQEGTADWAASVSLEGAYGIRDVSLGVPISMERGIPSVREFPLNALEYDVLLRASAMVRQQAQAIGGL